MSTDDLYDVLDLSFSGRDGKKKRDSKAKQLRKTGWLVQIESDAGNLEYNLFAQREKR